jgi:hypothetical protein
MGGGRGEGGGDFSLWRERETKLGQKVILLGPGSLGTVVPDE